MNRYRILGALIVACWTMGSYFESGTAAAFSSLGCGLVTWFILELLAA